LLSKWPIRNKLLIGLALLLVIVATLSWSSFHGLYAYRGLVKSLSWRVNELPLATQLNRDVSDLRVSLSDTHDDCEFHHAAQVHLSMTRRLAREDFRVQVEAVRDSLERYREQVTLSEQHSARIGDSRRQWEMVQAIEAALARIAELDRDEDWIFERLKTGRLRHEAQRLQSLAARLPELLHENIQNFTEEVRGQYRTLIVLAWATTISAGLLMAVFVKLAYQWIFRPLQVLIQGSRQVAAGQFERRIYLETRDEMAELADAMNAMTARFQAIRDDLDRQVQERTKQVVRSEQLASVGFLAAGVAHEINNPLASIAMCAESLQRRLHDLIGADDERHDVVRDYLAMIQDEAFRCKDITEKLLDFSRLGDVKRQATDLGELVGGVIEMLGHLGKYHQKHVEFRQGDAVFVSVNTQEIKQVVLNLLANALDSLEADGTVTVELSQRDGYADLSFRDNGCGMTTEVLEHLFEPFFTRRRGGQGTGLGLSISYRIVADHGGQIDAASEGPGRGALFRVRLPLVTLEKKENCHQYQAA